MISFILSPSLLPSPPLSYLIPPPFLSLVPTLPILPILVLIILDSFSLSLSSHSSSFLAVITNTLTIAVVHKREYWRAITSSFSHSGIIHLAFNMTSLWGCRYLEWQVLPLFSLPLSLCLFLLSTLLNLLVAWFNEVPVNHIDPPCPLFAGYSVGLPRSHLLFPQRTILATVFCWLFMVFILLLSLLPPRLSLSPSSLSFSPSPSSHSKT